MSEADAIKVIQKQFGAPTKTKTGLLAGVQRSLETYGSQARTALGGASTKSAEEGIARMKEINARIPSQVDFTEAGSEWDKGNYLTAAGKYLKQSPAAIAENASSLAAMGLGARIGGVLGVPLGPLGIAGGASLGALGGRFVSSYLPQAGGNIEAQAEAQKARGEPVNISGTKAYGTAVGQAAIDTALMGFVVGKTGPIAKLLGMDEKAVAKKSLAEVTQMAQEKLLPSIARGAGRFLAVEPPGEITQDVMQRAQAGQDLTSAEAIEGYKDTLGTTVLMAPIGGAARVSGRSGAREQLEKLQKAQAAAKSAEEDRVAAAAEATKQANMQKPEYLADVAQRYAVLQKQYEDLNEKARRKVPATDFAGKAAQKEAGIALSVLKKDPETRALVEEYRAALPRIQALGGASAAPGLPAGEQGALFEGVVAPTGPVQEVEQDLDPRRTLRNLEEALAAVQAAAQEAGSAAPYVNQFNQLRAAIEQTTAAVAKLPKDPSTQIKKTRAALAVALENGDLETAARIEKKLEELLALQPAPDEFAPDTPVGGVSQSKTDWRDEKTMRRLLDFEAEADAQDLQDTQQGTVAAERAALQRIQQAPAGLTGDQFNIFGTEQTPSSAPLGQMRQILSGQDVTATAEETEGQGVPRQKGPGRGDFRLYNPIDSTPGPVTEAGLSERIQQLRNAEDISDAARALVARFDKALGAGNRSPEFMALVDEQLSKIERSVPGGPRIQDTAADVRALLATGKRAPGFNQPMEQGEGRVSTTEGRQRTQQDRPGVIRAGAAATAPLAPASTREAVDLASSDAARALNVERKEKYQQLVAEGVSPKEAARRVRDLAQPEGDMTQRRKQPAEVTRSRSVTGPDTLRGPGTRTETADMDVPDALEQQLRLSEGASTQDNQQQNLFADDAVGSDSTSRATWAKLENYLSSEKFLQMLVEQRMAETEVKKANPVAVGKWEKTVTALTDKLNKMLGVLNNQRLADATVKANKGKFAAVEAHIPKMQARLGELFVARTTLTAAIDKADARVALLTKDHAAFTAQQLALPRRSVAINRRIKDLLEVSRISAIELRDMRAEADRLNATAENLRVSIEVGRARLEAADLRQEVPFGTEVDAVKGELAAATAALGAERAAVEKAKPAAKPRGVSAEGRERMERSALADKLSKDRLELWQAAWEGKGTDRRIIIRLNRREQRMLDEQALEDAGKNMSYGERASLQTEVWLRLEIGKLDKQARALTAKVVAAKAKSASYSDLAKPGVAPSQKAFGSMRLGEYDASDADITGTQPVAGYSSIFKGMGNALRQQALLNDKREILNEALERRQALNDKMSPLLEQEAAQLRETNEATRDYGVEEADRVASLARARADLVDYQTRLTEASPADRKFLEGRIRQVKAEISSLRPIVGKISAGYRETSSAPAKLRTGTAESRTSRGHTAQPIKAVRTQKGEPAAAATEASNAMSAERAAGAKRLTKKDKRVAALENEQKILDAMKSNRDSRQTALEKARLDIAAKSTRGRTEPLDLQDLIDHQRSLEAQVATLDARIDTQEGNVQAAEIKALTPTERAERKATSVAGDAFEGLADNKIGDQDFNANDDNIDAASKFTEDRVSTPVSAEAVEAANDGRLLNVLDDLIANGSTPEIKAEAAKLKPLLLRTKISVEPDVAFEGESVAGLYKPDSNEIVMHPDGLTEQDLLHEMAHAATDTVLLADPKELNANQAEARKGLENMLKALKVRGDFKGLHAVSNVREFVAEVRSNAELRAKLDATGGEVSLLQRFRNWVAKMLFGDVRSAAALAMTDRILLPSRKIMGATATAAPSKRRAAPSLLEHFGEQLSAEPTLLEQAKDAKGYAVLAGRQAAADGRASLRAVMETGNKDRSEAAALALDSADSAIVMAQAVAETGAPALVKVAEGLYRTEAGHSKSLSDALAPLDAIPGGHEGKLHMLHAVLTIDRANQEGWNMLGRETGAAMEEAGRAAIAEAKQDTVVWSALQKAKAAYHDLTYGLVKYLDQTHALPRDVLDKMLADKNYVPFFRSNGDTVEMMMPDGHPRAIGDLRTQPWLAALKGDDSKLMSFPEAAMKNIIMLTQLGLQNHAMTEVAYQLQDIGRAAKGDKKPMQIHSGQGPDKATVLRFMGKPQPGDPADKGHRWLELDTTGTAAAGVPTQLLAQSVAGSYVTMPELLKVAQSFSGVLRSAVTRFPTYVPRQLYKDAFSASVQGLLKDSPLTAIAKVVKNFGTIVSGNSKEYEVLKKAGVLHSQIYTGSAKADTHKAMLQVMGKNQNPLAQVAAFMDRMALAADAAARVQAYKEIIEAGGSQITAIKKARDIQNFNRRGTSSSVQLFVHAIPFFNASIQSLDTMYRAAKGNIPGNELTQGKQKFFTRAVSMAVMAGVYAAMMEDDEDWQKMKLRDKLAYIHLPKWMSPSDEPMRLPGPFEVGLLFYSMPVMLVESMRSQFSSKDWGTVIDVIANHLPGSGSLMPQIAKGVYDVSRNYNSGTGRPIESISMERLDPTLRFTPSTSEVAKRFSDLLTAAKVPLSPIQIEYLANAYFAQIPRAVASMTDSLFEKASQEGIDKPTKHMSESPWVGTFFQNQRGEEDMQDVLEIGKRAEMSKASFEKLAKAGNSQDAQAYLDAHRAEIMQAPVARKFGTAMQNLRESEDSIRNLPQSSGVSADEKQKRITQITKIKQQIAASYLQAMKRIESSVAAQ